MWTARHGEYTDDCGDVCFIFIRGTTCEIIVLNVYNRSTLFLWRQDTFQPRKDHLGYFAD